MAARTITQPAEGSSLSSSVVRTQLQLLENEIADPASIDPGHLHTPAGVSATGTPSSSTFWRGDNTWATPVDSGGTVQTVSVASSNGFAGTSDGDPTDPTLTLSTTISGILKGNATAISAGTAGDVDSILPTQTGNNGKFLTTDGSNSSWATATTSPGGSDTYVQFNDSGSFGGVSTFTFDKTSATLLVGSVIQTGTLKANTINGDGVNNLHLNANNATKYVTIKSGGSSFEAQLDSSLINTANRTFTFPDASGTFALTSDITDNLTVGTTTITSGATTRILYDNAGTLGEYTITGTGTVVAMQSNPTLSGLTMTDATNIVLNTTTGTKIGTATSQKLAFYNSTPIVQPTGDIKTAFQNLGLGASITVAANTITSRTLWGQSYDGSANVTGSLTSVGNITGGASSMTITAGTGNSRTMSLQTTTSGGTATTFLSGDASQNTTLAGNLTLGASTSSITGAAGNMTITAGTGNSRTMTLRTTTSGGTATAAITMDATQGSTFGGDLTINAHNIITDTTTGIKIGTGTTQKLGFFNATPVVQQTGDVATALSTLGLVSTPTVLATTISTATESSDTTCFPVFVTASGTQTLAAKTNTTLTYNASTSSLGATLLTATTSVTSASILASSNDSGALGASGTAFSDLFLASGGVINWNAGNATLTHSSGLLTSNVPLSLGTSNALTTGTIELGAASDTTIARVSAGVISVEGVTVDTISATNTLTNKRITPRVLSAASYTTDTGSSLNGDTQDMFIVTAQTGALKFNNPSGTPTDGQKLIISVASSTTSARALTWDTAFGATTVALPTTTAATTATLTIGFIWSASKSLWQCVAVA